MREIRRHIDERQRRFAEHAFFARLRRGDPIERTMAFLRAPTFFVLTFQDILRLNEARVSDPFLRSVARHHRVEDAGHDRWFLHDVRTVTGSTPDLEWTFGPTHARTREAAYSLVSEVFRATDDRVRVALLFVLESSGEVMFREIVDYLERGGSRYPLRYFARSHLDVERAHELHEGGMHAKIDALEVPATVAHEAHALVDRAYDAIEAMYDGFEEAIVDAQQAGIDRTIEASP